MGAANILLIVGMSVFASLASEGKPVQHSVASFSAPSPTTIPGLNWFFIYRHDWHKEAKAKVAKAQSRGMLTSWQSPMVVSLDALNFPHSGQTQEPGGQCQEAPAA
jgi:hypothetical protein